MCQLGVNEAGSSERINTEMAQEDSRTVPLPDCIRHLKAMRLPLATTLAAQLENYEHNPDRMLKMRILRNVEQLEGVHNKWN